MVLVKIINLSATHRFNSLVTKRVRIPFDERHCGGPKERDKSCETTRSGRGPSTIRIIAGGVLRSSYEEGVKSAEVW